MPTFMGKSGFFFVLLCCFRCKNKFNSFGLLLTCHSTENVERMVNEGYRIVRPKAFRTVRVRPLQRPKRRPVELPVARRSSDRPVRLHWKLKPKCSITNSIIWPSVDRTRAMHLRPGRPAVTTASRTVIRCRRRHRLRRPAVRLHRPRCASTHCTYCRKCRTTWSPFQAASIKCECSKFWATTTSSTFERWTTSISHDIYNCSTRTTHSCCAIVNWWSSIWMKVTNLSRLFGLKLACLVELHFFVCSDRKIGLQSKRCNESEDAVFWSALESICGRLVSQSNVRQSVKFDQRKFGNHVQSGRRSLSEQSACITERTHLCLRRRNAKTFSPACLGSKLTKADLRSSHSSSRVHHSNSGHFQRRSLRGQRMSSKFSFSFFFILDIRPCFCPQLT